MTFPSHTYLLELTSSDADPDYVSSIRRNVAPLAKKNLPVLLTLGHLAFGTGVPYNVLLGIVKRTVDSYRVFPITKRAGGRRYICVPESNLLLVQRWIHENILCAAATLRDLSDSSTAYRPGSSHIGNALAHLGASSIIKLDLTQFFESISERQVYHVFRSLGYRAQVSFCLARICTRVLPEGVDIRRKKNVKRWQGGTGYAVLQAKVVGHLPQGAPTSPMLANLVCRKIDEELANIAELEELIYTRYADDMTFSGDVIDPIKRDRIIKLVSVKVAKNGFSLNQTKTKFSGAGTRRIVTGISVADEVPRLPRVYKDKIRQELYYISRFGLAEHCKRLRVKNRLNYLLRLAGRVRYAEFVEPVFGKKSMEKLLEAVPNFNELEQTANI